MKGKGKRDFGKGDFSKGGFRKGYNEGEKGKSYGKGWNYGGHGKGGFANAVGNEYAPMPIPAYNPSQVIISAAHGGSVEPRFRGVIVQSSR